MKFLKQFRSKSKIPDSIPDSKLYQSPHNYYGVDFTANLPRGVLRQIFEEVSPQSCEESYASSEELTYEGCTLCDVRDLAACSAVSNLWRDVAREVLYKHVHIDAVHYCEREIELAEKRKRRSFMNRNAEPIDAPKSRLLQLMRTVRENDLLAQSIQTLRLPYMTREACKSELARTVAVLTNLRYVDLPEGFFHQDPNCHALKQELQASCPQIRRIKYASDSERAFLSLSENPIWQKMEVLELESFNIDPHDLTYVLATFPCLQELKLVDLEWLDDDVFRTQEGHPCFPNISRLLLSGTPHIHALGLADYLSNPQNGQALTQLDLARTSVQPEELHMILSLAPTLQKLSISQEVDHPFPMKSPPIPPLASPSLKNLHYEITTTSSKARQPNLHSPIPSYSHYLASSLLTNSLPALTELYVRDHSLPDLLYNHSLSPHHPPPNQQPTPSSSPPHRTLAIFTKPQESSEWNFPSSPISTTLTPASPTTTTTTTTKRTRPISLMGTSTASVITPSWGREARKSTLVGDGYGGWTSVGQGEGGGQRQQGYEMGEGPVVADGLDGRGRGKLMQMQKKKQLDLWR